MAKKPKAEDKAIDKHKKNEKFKNTPRGWAERWGEEFALAKESHRKWRENGKVSVSAYLARDMKTADPQAPGYNLNLFASNINTMMSLLYGRVPQVSVDRRWADPNDQVARVASEMATRVLNADIEEAGEDFSSIMRACLQDRLLPGLGVARIRYDFTEGEEDDEETGEKVPDKADEWIEDIYVPWNDILWSPCRFWKEMRWVGFCLYKDRDEVKKLLGDEPDAESMLDRIPFNSKAPLENATQKTNELWDKAMVWEIWDKTHKKVFWWIEGFDRILKHADDPLELEGFFPCPPFFIANTTTMEYVPKSDYSFAHSLYREVDRLEERIALLTMAIKVVGVYDKNAGQSVGRLINETAENKLIPVDSWAAFAEKGGLKGSIEFLDIKQVAEVIEILQNQQDRRIAQLYQITGMSDIMRGQQQGDGRVSATADQLKVKFASIRVQAIQDEFTRFATDLQKLRFEVIAKHFDAKAIIRRSNMGNTDDAQLALKAAEFIKAHEVSKWRIIISPESMAMVDYSQLRQERTEYINSLGIFLQSSFPIAEKFPESAPILMELLKWGLAGFKGSKQIEGVVDRAIAAMEQQAKQSAGQPKPPDPETIKAQAKVKEIQANIQRDNQRHEADMQRDAATHAQEMDSDAKKFQMEMMKMMQEFKLELTELRMKLMGKHAEIQADQQDREHQLRTDSAQREHQLQTSLVEKLTPPAPEPAPLSLGQEEGGNA